MSNRFKYTKYIFFALGGAVFCSVFGVYASPIAQVFEGFIPQTDVSADTEAKSDSISTLYKVKKTVANSPEDLTENSPLDLKDPENIKRVVEYDPVTNGYVFKTMVGNEVISTPFSLSKQEYENYTEKQMMRKYFHEKNTENFIKGSENEFNFLDMQFGLGPAEKIFGPGGVQIKTQGTAEISMGLKNNKVDNPTLPARSRNKTYFDFDEQIQLNVNASVGDKMSFNMNYNTDATFDYDAQKLKLAYTGKEDEIIKSLEAGNVSMTTGSSLVRGGSALFGVKSVFQFGKLTATALVAQQESSSQTVSSKGGAQLRGFEFTADSYDEDRHFFLGHFFRDNYDKNVSKLPYISSGVEITKLEVWVTNKRGNYDEARNIVAFMDIGEVGRLNNSFWQPASLSNPSNNSNNLYNTINTQYPGARDISQVTQALSPLTAFGIEGGHDYEKVESARKMNSSEYILNSSLGYVSLKSKLNSDEVLAVAFEYTLNGQVYQVGEFSTSSSSADNSTQTLFLKLLKGTSTNPLTPMWDLMMKNVYSLNAYQLQKDKFKMDIQYMSDTTGVYLNYIQAGNIKETLLLRVMNLDRLDANSQPYPDGTFDYVEGYTIQPSTGRVIFPAVEPFGSYLADKIGDPVLAQKYCYYELYDSTLTVARQVAEKNKFRIKGEYKASSGAEINLNAMNVPRGSVVVTAGGMTLTENTDYTVDYTMGVVTILNQSILESGTNISVSLENQSTFSMQRKTMLGLDLQYLINPNFNIGGTVIHLSEKPLTTKVSMDDIPLKNTIYGFNASYKGQNMWLTNLVGAVPWINATAPSTVSVMAEYAQLIPGHSNAIKENGEVYLDDFESSQTGYDIRSPYAWQLASTPYDPASNALFPEAALSNDIRYGKNRALLNWYYIDRLFTQRSSSLTPSHIKGDLDQLSNHYVREINYSEIYPNKQLSYGESGVLTALNLSFYPSERGPYNLDVDGIDSDGYLINPESRWGGMMRKMDNSDFETANIEYIQFWMMDPFIYDSLETNIGGDLYFNLGEVSEDILKDGKKAFENGLPIDNDTTYITNTVWGRVSKRNSTVYAFDNTAGARKKQDVGFNGLSTEDEFEFPTYKNYVEKLMQKLSPTAISRMRDDQFSPLNDPAGDNYHYFRGSDYDNEQRPVLERYKRYNNVEGNSTASEDSPEKYDVSAKSVPDVEDINQDNTLNEYERYFQYRISVRPKDMVVGQNFITDKKIAKVKLRNGKEETINWYQFKVPLSDYEKQVGSIKDFKSIRFMRMFMTQFSKDVHLRFATMDLMRGDWRTYTQALNKQGVAPVTDGQLDVSVMNIEENSGSQPVNYIMPPGVSRIVDPGQSQITQLNEQSLSMRVTSLAPSDARAVYKNMTTDLRRFERIQLFVHAEALIDNSTNLSNGELSVFMRIGSDYKDNYYEYEIPLKLTQPGIYNNSSSLDRNTVWPQDNMFDLPLSLFTDLKLERNAEKRKSHSNVSFTTLYTSYDPDKKTNKVSIVGNPTLSEVKTIMIGVRNNSKNVKSGTVWVNELRLTDFKENGGWAAKANVNIGVSDIATVNFGGHVETSGFGSVDQSLTERRMDDYYQYNIATQVDLGRLVPEKVKLSAPMFYSYSKEIISPEYDPYNQDITLEQSLENAGNKRERDSIKNMSQEIVETKSFSLSNVRFNYQSKNPMPWDPANLSAGYSFSHIRKQDPTTEYEDNFDYKGTLVYSYSPFIKPIAPWARSKNKSPYYKLMKDFSLQWLPNTIGLYSSFNRTYYEQQLRNVDADGQSGSYSIPVSYSKKFHWNRQTTVNWNLTKTIRMNFNAATNSRIDEPNVPVNKRLYRDEYEIWKDSISQSIKNLGTPIDYNQTFDATFNVPLNKFPLLDWTTLNLKYNANYAWNRGVYIDEYTRLGNSINNQAAFGFDTRFNMETLYNKSKFLKETNRKFSNVSRTSSNRSNINKKTARKFNQRVRLKPDTTVTVKHNLDTRRLIVSAKDNKNKTYNVEYKVKDRNSITITNKDSIPIQLSVLPAPGFEDKTWYKMTQYGARTMMMVRNVSVNYKLTNSTYLPSFIPNVGDFLGQNNSGDFMAPGVGFAFGFKGGESYVDEAASNGWLIMNDSVTTPATYSKNEDLQIRVALEPLRGLKIDLTGNRASNNSNSHQYMFDNVAIQRSGNFVMTTIGIKTSLRGANSDNGYQSDAFDQFINNRQIIADRINSKYSDAYYPSGGFMEGNYLANSKFNPQVAGDRLNSADVMIPAFIAAYTGKDASKVGLSAFPSLKEILPNWKVTYDGLGRIPLLARYFKSINLTHAYRCTYAVGSFSSFLNYMENDGGYGFTLDATSGNPVPSTPFDISTVTMTESYAPLLGIDMTLKNNMTLRTEYKDTRNLSLNMSSVQIVEALTKDYTIGAGYKISNFNTVLGMPGGGQKGVNHDLNIRGDLTYRIQNALIRKIEEVYTQATSGTKTFTIKVTADYTFSRLLTVRAYYDKQINTPLVSSSTYPISSANYGITFKLSLTR